ncbi:MAG: photosynthetic complex assembly protein PuhC [Pseudomonadota bacterium]
MPIPLHAHKEVVPKPLLIAIGGMMAFAVCSAIIAGATGFGAVETAAPTVLEETRLKISDRADGAVIIADYDHDGRVRVFEPKSGGFIRVALRGLAHSRQSVGAGSEAPFILKSTADQGLILEDPVTDQRISLRAFGKDNARAFEQFFDAEQAETSDDA